MNAKVFNSVIMAACGILFCLIMADASGEWTGSLLLKGSTLPVTYDFKVDGDTLIGQSQTPLGNSTITQGRIEKDKISFRANMKGEPVLHTGRVYRDSIVLKMYYQGQNLTTTLFRVSR